MNDRILSCGQPADSVDQPVNDFDRPQTSALTDEQSCTLQDIEVLLVQSLRFTATAEGEAQDYIDVCDYDSRDVNEYYCDNCDTYWTVDEKYTTRWEAWQAVRDHLSGQAGVV